MPDSVVEFVVGLAAAEGLRLRVRVAESRFGELHRREMGREIPTAIARFSVLEGHLGVVTSLAWSVAVCDESETLRWRSVMEGSVRANASGRRAGSLGRRCPARSVGS